MQGGSLKRRLPTQEIYTRLRRMITDFDLLPGTRVTESELAALFKVSRTPIREALHRLEVEGLLSIRPKQGCFIRQVDIAQISNYYEVRVGLEALAIELACKNMPDAELEALAAFWNPARRLKTADPLEAIRDAEEAFHVSLAEAGGNPVLADYLRDVNDHIRALRRVAFIDEQTLADTFEDHYAICRLLLKRDAKAARNAMVAHIRKSQETARNVTLSQIQQPHKRKPRSLRGNRRRAEVG
jgi:DNA-binding GntR family transcriptional regulator